MCGCDYLTLGGSRLVTDEHIEILFVANIFWLVCIKEFVDEAFGKAENINLILSSSAV